VCETVARRFETAHVADSQRSSDPLFKYKRSRTIANGDGLRLSFGKKSSRAWCRGWFGFAQARRIPSCETRLTLTATPAAPLSDRLAKSYARHSKKIKNCPRTLECDSNDSANQKAELSVLQKRRDQDTTNKRAAGGFRPTRGQLKPAIVAGVAIAAASKGGHDTIKAHVGRLVNRGRFEAERLALSERAV